MIGKGHIFFFEISLFSGFGLWLVGYCRTVDFEYKKMFVMDAVEVLKKKEEGGL